MVEAAAPGAFIERPMGTEDPTEQRWNLIEVARSLRANTSALVTGDNHALLSVYGNAFQPVPTAAATRMQFGPGGCSTKDLQ